MNDYIEIISYTDPPYIAERQVWYYLAFQDRQSAHVNDWVTVNAWALALYAEHDGRHAICDRSDKGTYLHLTL